MMICKLEGQKENILTQALTKYNKKINKHNMTALPFSHHISPL